MASCSHCGQSIAEDAAFCSRCGWGVSGDTSLAPAPPPAPNRAAVSAVVVPPRVVVVEPRRAGRLAVGIFILCFIVVVARSSPLKPDDSLYATVFGVGAAAIVAALVIWKRNNEVVRGTFLAWTLTIIMSLIAFGSFLGGSYHGSTSSSTDKGNSAEGNSPAYNNPKDVLLRDVKLDFRWHKGGFGSVMLADFTVKNPTQYSFKDFEVKCTHTGPSGTVIDSNTRTIYEIVRAGSTKHINEQDMGFIHSQATKSYCEITDLVALNP